MNAPVTPAAITEFLNQRIAEVFDTLLSLPATPQPEAVLDEAHPHLSGAVGFAGETVTGSVYLHVNDIFGNFITQTMLGLPPEEVPGESDVKDVAGEVTNMLGGAFKSWLCDAGAKCALTAPAVIRGLSYSIRTSEGVTRIRQGFTCGEHTGVAEIHIKFA